MNRRQLLHTLTVLTTGGIWTAFACHRPAMAVSEPRTKSDNSLLLALAEAKTSCQSILSAIDAMQETGCSRPVHCLNALSVLIDQAVWRAAERSHNGPAFWQSCSDAFHRAAEQLPAFRTADPTGIGELRQAEDRFRWLAYILSVKTVNTAEFRTIGAGF